MSDFPIDPALNPQLGKTRFGERPLSNREYMQLTAASCAMSSPKPKCTGNVFVGLFFDGTGNNEDKDFKEPAGQGPRYQKHSNVVRLYHAHPDALVTGNNGYYRYYIPGVGTRFDEIGDSGSKLGSSFARYGAARVAWGLTRVFNAVSRYAYRGALIDDDEATRLASEASSFASSMSSGSTQHPPEAFKAQLQSRLKAKLRGYPPVTLITVNVFGFSRGAAQARAFVNWLFEICEQRDGGWFFAGIALQVQFLGLFDTVASVGPAGVYKIFEGRMGWAENNLQVHPAVPRCVHMVAAHEVRGCFPLDSVRVDGKYPANVVEYVYPGAHSDVGGGYMARSLGTEDWKTDAEVPDEQLARVPGYEMYCVARAAGVPFSGFNASGPLKPMDDPTAAAIKPSPATIKAFDNYIRAASIVPAPIEEMARQHMSLYFTHRWRMGAKFAHSPQMRRALARPNQGDDYAAEPEWMNDTQTALISVIAGLCKEIERRIQENGTRDEPLHQLFDGQLLKAARIGIAGMGPVAVPIFAAAAAGVVLGTTADGFAQRRRLLRSFDSVAMSEMTAVAQKAPDYLRKWKAFLTDGLQADVRDPAPELDGVRLLEALNTTPLPHEVTSFFDSLVHDSMAGFIGAKVPEFEVNGFGIAKFRRIYFGNRGDAILSMEVERRNKAGVAAADKRRADRVQWDLEAREFARTRP